MNLPLSNIKSLLWFIILHGLGIYLFYRGFFLTRFEIPKTSSCSNTAGHCVLEPTFDQVIIIVIDALRFDYVLWNESSDKYSSRKLETIHDLYMNYPEKSLLFQFEADPPSVTMQRLKGLTTGGMPTFIDISENFGGSRILEDNLIDQMKARHKRITFMGDDTWESLYPVQFNKSFPFPSFNALDLHTVDDGVISHLVPEIQANDWDVLIAHFLGVDHVGHRFESNHPAMADKLRQMDRVLRTVIDSMPERTLLVVLGDHGSTDDGNHGGATAEELNAALFLYSPQSWLSNQIDRQTESGQPQSSQAQPAHPARDYLRVPHVRQTGLVPSLALLLDLPIPFSNVGSLIPELFLLQDLPDRRPSVHHDPARLVRLSQAMLLNSQQIATYLRTYNQRTNAFDTALLAPLLSSIEPIPTFDRLTGYTAQEHLEFFAKHEQFQSRAGQLCREIWVVFQLEPMQASLVVLSLTVLAVLLFTCSTTPPNLPSLLLLLLGFTLHLSSLVPGWLVVLSAVLSILLYFARVLLRGFFAELSPTDPVSMFVTLLVALHGFGLFSNSYIEAEPAVIRFLLCSLIFVTSGPVWPKLLMLLGARFTADLLLPFVGRFEFSGELLQPLLVGYLPLLGLALLSRRELGHWDWRLGLETVLVLLYWAALNAGWLATGVGLLAKDWLPRTAYLLLAVSFARSSSGPQSLAHLTLLLCLSLGPSGALALLAASLLRSLFYQHLASSMRQTSQPPWLVALFQSLLATWLFFVTGHRNDFNSIQYSAGFVGFEQVNWIAGGVLTVLNTFCGPIWAVGALFAHPPSSVPSPAPSLVAQSGSVAVRMIAYFGLNQALTSCFVYTARRHLMVWRVFAPKFIFDSVILLVVDLVILVCLAVSALATLRAKPAQKQA